MVALDIVIMLISQWSKQRLTIFAPPATKSLVGDCVFANQLGPQCWQNKPVFEQLTNASCASYT